MENEIDSSEFEKLNDCRMNSTWKLPYITRFHLRFELATDQRLEAHVKVILYSMSYE